MIIKSLQTVPQKKINQSLAMVLFFFVLNSFTFSVIATPIIPEDILEKIDREKIYNNKQWKRQLHYKKGKSELDDPSFFLSKSGKTNLKAEMLASISKLITDKSDTEKSIQCYYPSRSHWLLGQFPSLKHLIFTPQCVELHKEIDTLAANQATIILASAHINSPASAFGHTFLRLDSSDDTILASYAVNYAAITQEKNGIIYAYEGLFGGYQGRYSVGPYSKRLETYSDLEQRDIWEYPLKLTGAEINRMVLHILEIRNFYADYFFLDENCSYNLLWLLEVAKKDVELTRQFGFHAIPIDTVRAIGAAGLIKDVVYRPSKRRKILTKSKNIQHIPVAMKFANGTDYDFDIIKSLSKIYQAKTLELASHLLQVKFNKREVPKKYYLKNFIRLLKARSKLGDLPDDIINQPTMPRKSHLSNKLSLSYDSQGTAEIRVKAAYHDIYDNESGFISGAYINFFDVSVKHDKDKLLLSEVNLIDIRSYAVQDLIFKPISWQVSLGGRRALKNDLQPFIQAGAGITLGSDRLFSYATLTPSLYFAGKENYQSLSTNIGAILNYNPKLKMGLLTKAEWFRSNKRLVEVEPFITYSTSKNTALKLGYNYKDIDGEKVKNTQLSLFWYY
jgi:hypothetical protein